MGEAGFLGARNLTLPSVGTSALIGWLLATAWARREGWRGRPLLLGSAALLALIHLLAAPLTWFVSDGLYTRIMVAATEAVARAMDLLGQ